MTAHTDLNELAGTECYIYVIGIEDLNVCKIGISADPSKRARQLSTGSPFKVSLETSFWFPTRDLALLFEGIFHGLWRAHRVNGEWFKFHSDAAIVCIAHILRDFIELEPLLPMQDVEKMFASISEASVL